VDEHRKDQVRRMQPMLAHQVAREGVAAQASGAADRERRQ
jgi:hypothetical protein